MRVRALFPYVYLALVAPVFVATPTADRFVLLVAILVLAIVVGRSMVWSVGRIAAASALTLVPFVLIVQWAVCASQMDMYVCVQHRSIAILVNVGLATSILLLASANEWRGSIVSTVNGLNVPRDLRIMFAISGVMVGEFRKVTVKVHDAFTSRGDALPALNIGNLFALPRMLAVAWGAVLHAVSGRLELLWASDVFWERVMPRSTGPKNVPGARWRDATVLAVIGLSVLLTIFRHQ